MAVFPFGKKQAAAEGADFGGTNTPISQVLNMKSQGMNNSQIANQLRSQGFSLTQIRDALAQADIKSAVGNDMGNFPEFGPQNMGNMQGVGNMPNQGNMNDFSNMPEVGPMPDFGDMSGMENMEEFGLPPVSQNAPMPELPPSPGMMMPQQAGIVSNTEVLVNELQRILEEIIEEKWKGVDEKITALEIWKTKLEEKINSLSEVVGNLNKRVDDFANTIASKTEGYTRTIQDVNVQMEAMEKMMGKLVPSLAEEIKELRNVVDKAKGK